MKTRALTRGESEMLERKGKWEVRVANRLSDFKGSEDGEGVKKRSVGCGERRNKKGVGGERREKEDE